MARFLKARLFGLSELSSVLLTFGEVFCLNITCSSVSSLNNLKLCRTYWKTFLSKKN